MKAKYFINDKFVFPDEILSIVKIECHTGLPGICIHYLSNAEQILSFSSGIDRDITYSFILDKAKENVYEI